jgi:T-complex protein 1 subunit zeta
VKGPNDHVISQIKDAIRDGLRAVKNTIDDKAVVPGAGAFEVAACAQLQVTTFFFKFSISEMSTH